VTMTKKIGMTHNSRSFSDLDSQHPKTLGTLKELNHIRGVKKNATLEKSRAGVNSEILRRLMRCEDAAIER
jgi:hypothetical protein